MANYVGTNIGEAFQVPAGDAGVGNTYDGRGGFDDIFYNEQPGAINLDLSTGLVVDASGGIDTISGFEGMAGTLFDDTITGDDGGNILRPFGGIDTVNGGDGRDMIHYELDYQAGISFQNGIILDFDAGTVVDPGGSTDTFTSIERVRATHYDDTLLGSDRDEGFAALGGNDHIDGGDGFDIYEAGDLFPSYGDVHPGVTLTGIFVDLALETATDMVGDTDTLIGIEGAVGGELADTLDGTDQENFFSGLEGDDLIDGRGGADTITAGDGDDTIRGGLGTDNLSGGDGDDLFVGTAAQLAGDTITDLEFGDVVQVEGATSLQASIVGGSLNIDEDGNGSVDAVVNLTGASGTVLVVGDEIHFINEEPEPPPFVPDTGPGSDFVPGDPSDTAIYANDGNDSIYGGGGSDTVYGGEGDDHAFGGEQDDVVFGGGGNDTVGGGDGADAVGGGRGDDQVSAGAGNDAAYGGAGSDHVFGGVGDDTAFGGVGDDMVDGGDGDDIIWGGAGSDLLYGGTGADLFRFKDNSDSDVIADFDGIGGDRIDLQGQLFEVTTNAGGEIVIVFEQNDVLMSLVLRGVTTFDQDWIVG